MKWKVLLEGSCEACQQDLESSGHLFWGCESVREVWAILKLFPTSLKVYFSSFMDMIWYGVMGAGQNREDNYGGMGGVDKSELDQKWWSEKIKLANGVWCARLSV